WSGTGRPKRIKTRSTRNSPIRPGRKSKRATMNMLRPLMKASEAAPEDAYEVTESELNARPNPTIALFLLHMFAGSTLLAAAALKAHELIADPSGASGV